MPLLDSNVNALEWTPTNSSGQPGETQTFFFDGGWISEQHNAPSRVTENPVASGRVVNDHLIIDPATLTLVGIITDTPFITRQIYDNVLTKGLSGIVPSITSAIQLGSPRRSGDAYLTLLSARQYLMTVHTSLGTYYNMACLDIGTPQDYTTGGVTVTMRFQEMLIIDNTENLSPSGLQKSQSSDTFLGNMTTNTATAAQNMAITAAGILL